MIKAEFWNTIISVFQFSSFAVGEKLFDPPLNLWACSRPKKWTVSRQNIISQHDSDLKHTARGVSIQALSWRLAAQKPEGIRDFCKEEWTKIPPEMCTNLVTNYKQMSYHCPRQQGFLHQVLSRVWLGNKMLILVNDIQINS